MVPEDQPADRRDPPETAGDLPAGNALGRRIASASTVGLPSPSEQPPGPTGEADPQRLRISESLAGRFTVLRFIARGGMGAVYEALDVMLKTRVALKVIHGRIATDATAMERFRREVLLARRVTHANVCRVYELYEATTAAGLPIRFLTMELLEGETLAVRMARQGRLTTMEARPLVEQMCEGLAAAHAEGVIHRDFKSSNVMLVRRGASVESKDESTRVVVTDFGVARALDVGAEPASEGPLTGTAAILGTPEYMAPEQVTGGEVSAATDIYALGVVMYEMVTGKLPFAGGTALTSAARRLNETPPRPEVSVPGLDKRWAETVLRCLARQPDRRFQNARDVISSLDRAPQRRPRTLAIAAAALVLLVGGFAWLRNRPSLRLRETVPTGAQRVPRPVVAILGFRDELTAPQLKWLPVAVSELLGHELAAAETSLRVIPGDRVAQVRRSLGVSEDGVTDERTRERMQALLGANLLVFGSLAPKASGAADVRLRLHLLDAQTGKEAATVDEDLGPSGAQLPAAAVALGTELRKALGVTLLQDEEAALSASRVRNVDASQAYAQGVLSLRKFEYTDSRNRFEAALAADSNFLLAQRRMVDSWERQGYAKKAREAAQRIRARPSGLTSRQVAELDARLLILGSEAKRGSEAQIALFDATPDDVELGLDSAFMFHGVDPLPRTQLAVVRRLRQLPAPISNDIRLDIMEAEAVARLGEANRAQELLTKAGNRAAALGAKIELGWLLRERADLLWVGEARGVEALGLFADADRTFTEVGELDELAWTKRRIAMLRGSLGPPSQALAALDEAASLYRTLGDRRTLQELSLNSADALETLGEVELARKKFDEARSELEALGEPLSAFYFWLWAELALDDVDLQGVRKAAHGLRAGPVSDEAGALALEAVALREQDHLEEARDAKKRAAVLAEQQGQPLMSAMHAAGACRLYCEEGKPAQGLACLARQSAPVEGMVEGGQHTFLLYWEAMCRAQTDDLSGAQRAGEAALSNAERLQDFGARVSSSVLLMQIAAARGDSANAISTLRAHLDEAESKHERALALGVRLALGEVELNAGRPEGRIRLSKLEQEAKSLEFFRIARLAREALDKKPAVVPRR